MDALQQVWFGLRVDAWLTGGVVIAMVGGLIHGRVGADLVILSGLAALLVTGVLTPTEALHGFANPALATVALLYVVAAGLNSTGAMTRISTSMLGQPKSVTEAQVRLTGPVAVTSAFVNNTPIVAMFLPVLSSWAKRNNLAPSRLFIPLSYAAMLGGMCTLIGTSTNLVVAGLIRDHVGIDEGMHIEPLGMFTIAWVGVPAAIVGLVYILLAGRWLLPDRDRGGPSGIDPRQYTAAMRVAEKSPLAGRTVEQAGLRRLPRLFLARIERENETIIAVAPEQRLHAGDVLVFVGVVDSVVDLQKINGLEPLPPGDDHEGGGAPRHAARLIEAVVSPTSPLVNRSIREGSFRSRYNAVVIAAHRHGERLRGKLGDIRLRAGDTLLLEAPPDFAETHRSSRDFYLVNALPGAAAPRHHLTWIAIGILLLMVSLITWRPEHAVAFALVAALAMVLTRCCTGPEARSSVDWQVLLVIGATFGLGRAMEKTGLASVIAGGLVDGAVAMGPRAVIAVIFAITALFTSVITNNAAAVLVFPIALEAARANGIPFTPVAVTVAIAASAGFATPLGYQTNLMVMGPGGHRTSDFIKFGLPLTLLVGVVCVLVAPLVFGAAV